MYRPRNPKYDFGNPAQYDETYDHYPFQQDEEEDDFKYGKISKGLYFPAPQDFEYAKPSQKDTNNLY